MIAALIGALVIGVGIYIYFSSRDEQGPPAPPPLIRKPNPLHEEPVEE